MKRLFATFFILLTFLASTNAQALMLTTFSGDTYDVIAIGPASFNDNDTLLMNTPWWDNPDLARELTQLWYDNSGGFPNDLYGEETVWFAFDNGDLRVGYCTPDCPEDGPQNSNLIETDIGFYAVEASQVPLPAAAWLFMSGLVGLVWKGRKASQSA